MRKHNKKLWKSNDLRFGIAPALLVAKKANQTRVKGLPSSVKGQGEFGNCRFVKAWISSYRISPAVLGKLEAIVERTDGNLTLSCILAEWLGRSLRKRAGNVGQSPSKGWTSHSDYAWKKMKKSVAKRRSQKGVEFEEFGMEEQVLWSGIIIGNNLWYLMCLD